jgi:disulfide bond formation protein DsbB
MISIQASIWVKPRTLLAAVFLACLAIFGFALYLQHVEVLEPCPMCILQRYSFAMIALIALIGAIHNPGPIGAGVYGVLVLAGALTGAGIATRHSWLQRFPSPSYSCGADLEYLLDTFPLAKALPAIFAGTGECSEVQWRMLGLSIPEWALIWFVLFAIAALVVIFKARRSWNPAR